MEKKGSVLTLSDMDLVLTELRRIIKEGDTDSNKIMAAEVLGRTVKGLFKAAEEVQPQISLEDIYAEIEERFGPKIMKTVRTVLKGPDKAVH